MAKEPPSGKKSDGKGESDPGQQGDDILSDSSIEELDLESLLSEELSDEPSSAPRGPKAAGAGSPKEGAVVDDGEIDLLADDILEGDVLEEAEPVTAGDLLGVDDTAEEMAAGATALAAESSTNGQKMSSGDVVGDVLDDAAGMSPEIDLLADDPDPYSTHSGAAKSDAPRALSHETEDEPLISEAMEESALMAKATDEPEEGAGMAAESSPEGPPAKKGKGSKSTKKQKNGAGKKSAAVKNVRKEESRPAAAVRVRGSVAFVCSECYEEFLLPSNYSQEMVSCPDCLHVGKRPDEDFLRTVSLHKAGERKSFLLALAAGVVLLAIVLGLLWLTSDPHLAQGKAAKPDSNLVLGLVGGSAVLAALFIWLSVRFEGNRWEVYF